MSTPVIDMSTTERGPGSMLILVNRWFRLRSCPLTWGAKAVLGAIADYCGTTDAAWPGENQIARHATISTRTVERGVAELRAAGLIEVKRRPGDTWGSRSNVYRVNRALIEALIEDSQADSTRLTGGMSSTQPDSQAAPDPPDSRTQPDSQAGEALNEALMMKLSSSAHRGAQPPYPPPDPSQPDPEPIAAPKGDIAPDHRTDPSPTEGRTTTTRPAKVAKARNVRTAAQVARAAKAAAIGFRAAGELVPDLGDNDNEKGDGQ